MTKQNKELNHQGAILAKYLQSLRANFDESITDEAFLKALLTVTKEGPPPSSPFLTVVTRTQGRRFEALSETLLCLSAQTDTDFEVLIMGHNLKEAETATVTTAILDLPPWMQEKVRLIQVEGGTRTTPLTVGFEAAKGEYISILDDDDLVFDNWVETFHTLRHKKPGALLHAFCVTQKWTTVTSQNGTLSLCASSSPETIYCRKFSLTDQLTNNYCPTMSYACPRFAYDVLQIHFDESLTTTEDWDFLMRTVFVTGVIDSEAVTSIYRKWEGYENSQTLHARKEWKENYKHVTKKIQAAPILIPAEEIKRLMTEQAGENHRALQEASLYYTKTDQFTERNRLSGTIFNEQDRTVIEFTNLEALGKLQHLRLDPMELGLVCIMQLQIDVMTLHDGVQSFQLSTIKSNGVLVQEEDEDALIFLKSDPQIFIKLKRADQIDKIQLSLLTYDTISDKSIDKAIKILHTARKGNLLFRLAKRIKRMFSKE